MIKTTFGGALALVATSLVACGGPPKQPATTLPVGRAATAAVALPAVTLPIVARTVRGALVVQRGADWEPLAEGAALAGVHKLRADRRGAIVTIGDATLYLRGGTELAVGQAARGVSVRVVAGRARVRSGMAVTLYSALGTLGLTALAGDQLIDATSMAPTGTRPEAAAFAFGLDAPDDAVAIGKLEARDTTAAMAAADQLVPVTLRAVDVKVTTQGDLAITEVTHVFHSDAAVQREGTFRFPLPDGAMLVGLAMEIDGKLIEGEFVEREKARAVYDKIVDQMLDPALLEWEHGNWFKLRVFPIPATGDKRVVIRYATPLVHAAGGWQYEQAIAAPEGTPIGELAVTVNGQVALRERDVTSGVDVTVPIAAKQVPSVMRELRDDGVYTAVRITPTLPVVTARAPAAPRTVAIVIDTSRSALEGRAQELEVLQATLRELAPGDRFVVIASDVAATPLTPDYQPVTAVSIAAAVASISAIDADGASDLGAALAVVDAREPSTVVYIGDGIATWGEQAPAALAAAAAHIGAPVYAALVGKGASSQLWSTVAGASGGSARVVRSHDDAEAFALVATAPIATRLVNAHVVGPAGASVFPATAVTVMPGDELVALIKTPAGQPAPDHVTLTGSLDGKPYSQDISLVVATATERVAQRWAREELLRMQEAEAPREEIVALSTAMGVMSPYTSLLVLENDAMYKQFDIARKQAAAQATAEQIAAADPTVTGGDLDTLGARQASLSPDEIQPGDPEIKIPAPANARAVIVSFPFGETKLAVWDPEVHAWMVRFLIDQSTADGDYQVRVTVTHADGSVHVLSLPYTVDTKAPVPVVTVKQVAGGYRIRVKQAKGDPRRDLDRVEVTLPDGTVMTLTQITWSRFEKVWTPLVPLAGPLHLRVVARDAALNQSVTDVIVNGAQ